MRVGTGYRAHLLWRDVLAESRKVYVVCDGSWGQLEVRFVQDRRGSFEPCTEHHPTLVDTFAGCMSRGGDTDPPRAFRGQVNSPQPALLNVVLACIEWSKIVLVEFAPVLLPHFNPVTVGVG